MKLKGFLFITVSAVVLLFVYSFAFGAIGIGIPPESQELMPGSSVAKPDEKKPEIQVRILLFSLSKPFSISAPGGLALYDADGNLSDRHQEDTPLEFSLNDKGLIVAGNFYPQGTAVLSAAALNEELPVSIGGKKYRGRLLLISSGGAVRVINCLDLEKYLYGVVPKELRTKFSEMGKAQAVVARTFAVAHLGRFEKDGYDFTDDTRFQVYGGFDAEDPDSTKAVDDTRGQVLTYYGKLVMFALYHSTCGGMTSDNESVFLTGPIGYLKPVRCLWNPDGDGEKENVGAKPEKVDQSGLSDKDFAEALDGETAGMCSSSRYYRWDASWTEDQLLEDVRLYSKNNKIRKVKGIRISKRSSSGRALELEIDTDEGKIIAEGNNIRWVLRVRLPGGGITSLYSTRFAIWKEGSGYRAKGAGWGHGLGLCQFGGLGMAKRGAGYREILQKYFYNCQITDLDRVEGLKIPGVKP